MALDTAPFIVKADPDAHFREAVAAIRQLQRYASTATFGKPELKLAVLAEELNAFGNILNGIARAAAILRQQLQTAEAEIAELRADRDALLPFREVVEQSKRERKRAMELCGFAEREEGGDVGE